MPSLIEFVIVLLFIAKAAILVGGVFASLAMLGWVVGQAVGRCLVLHRQLRSHK
jgi:hypothetical protein